MKEEKFQVQDENDLYRWAIYGHSMCFRLSAHQLHALLLNTHRSEVFVKTVKDVRKSKYER